MVEHKKRKIAMKKILLSSTLFLFLSFSVFAQTSTETTIDEKFTELITNSNNFKGYKVVDTDELTRLQTLTSQRIAELKEEISGLDEAALEQEENMATLKANLESLELQLQELKAEKDAISFLGMSVSKSYYQTTMWAIIAGLILALVFFIFRFKRSHVHTKEAKQNLQEIEKEFEAYRAKSLEKEQRLGRLLQDEKNKHMKIAK